MWPGHGATFTSLPPPGAPFQSTPLTLILLSPDPNFGNPREAPNPTIDNCDLFVKATPHCLLLTFSAGVLGCWGLLVPA